MFKNAFCNISILLPIVTFSHQKNIWCTQKGLRYSQLFECNMITLLFAAFMSDTMEPKFSGFIVETIMHHNGHVCFTGTQTVERISTSIGSQPQTPIPTETTKTIPKRERRVEYGIYAIEALIRDKFGQKLSHAELLVVAKFVSDAFRIPIDRDASRRKNSLLAWCAENYTEFTSVLKEINGERGSSSDEEEEDMQDASSA